MPEGARLLVVAGDHDGWRLDRVVAQGLPTSRAGAAALVRDGSVTVNGRPAGRPADPVRAGDRVGCPLPVEVPVPLPPAGTTPLRIVHEDAALAVIDKPAGLVVHPGAGHPSGTMVDWLRQHGGPWSQLGGPERAGIVHRLDRGTSGLLVVARTDSAHRQLQAQLADRTLGREYWALAEGGVLEQEGRVEAAIGRDPAHPRRMAVTGQGRDAVTEFSVLERLPRHTALRVRLRSGRTHQIRVHLAYIGRPVAADPLYGRRDPDLPDRPALHAAHLAFRHPVSGARCDFWSPLPPDLVALRLRRGAPAGTASPWPPDPAEAR